MSIISLPSRSSSASIPSASAARPLSGTLPVRTFHPEGFFGSVQVDGQSARVAALACVEGKLLLVSLVGYDTTVSAILAHLWQSKAVPLTLKAEVNWTGPQVLLRRQAPYKQFATKLAGTTEVHVVALALDAHIGEGLLTPPAMQCPDEADKGASPAPAQTRPAFPFPKGGPRFVLGNWDEAEPQQRAFLAHLYAMRVILLHQRDPTHPEWVDQWARELWERGLARDLIVPVDALGINAWTLAGTTPQWNRLIGQGVRERWLPWREEPAQHFANAA
jgi:hypothetical protein